MECIDSLSIYGNKSSPHTKKSALTSPVRAECGMFVMYCMQWCISVSDVFVVCGCAVSRKYINV